MIKIPLDFFTYRYFRNTCCFHSDGYLECLEYVNEQLAYADFNEAKSGVAEYFASGEINDVEKDDFELRIASQKYDFHTRCNSDFSRWQELWI